MALDLISASSQRLSMSAPLTGGPWTFAIWYRPTTVAVSNGLLTPASATQYAALGYTYLSQRTSYFTSGGESDAPASTGNTWQHYAVYQGASGGQAIAYRNGVAGNTVNTVFTGATVTQWIIGALLISNAYYDHMNGMLANIGVWQAQLTAEQIGALAKGISPRLVRPQYLRLYAPMIRAVTDLRQARTITRINGPTAGAHPRTYL